MKILTILVASVFSCLFLNAQNKDSVSYSSIQSFYEVRLNPKDTAFSKTKFPLPPTGFIIDNNASIKTKAEVDSITNLINKLQQEIINRHRQLHFNIVNDSIKNESTK